MSYPLVARSALLCRLWRFDRLRLSGRVSGPGCLFIPVVEVVILWFDNKRSGPFIHNFRHDRRDPSRTINRLKLRAPRVVRFAIRRKQLVSEYIKLLIFAQVGTERGSGPL